MSLLPAFGHGPKELLDSNFLRRYAARMERQAKAAVVWNTFVGGMVGYAFGLMLTFVHHVMSKATELEQMLQKLRGAQPVAPQDGLEGYIPIALGVAFAALWGLRGMGKADELRFQAQMALHLLKVYDMERVLEEKTR